VSRMESNESRCRWSINNLSSLVTHPAVASDAEFQLRLVQFLFINAFFVVKHATSEIACVCDYCIHSVLLALLSVECIPLPCNTKIATVSSLSCRTEGTLAYVFPHCAISAFSKFTFVFTAWCYAGVVYAGVVSVCSSIRPLQAGTVLKLLNVGSCKEEIR